MAINLTNDQLNLKKKRILSSSKMKRINEKQKLFIYKNTAFKFDSYPDLFSHYPSWLTNQ